MSYGPLNTCHPVIKVIVSSTLLGKHQAVMGMCDYRACLVSSIELPNIAVLADEAQRPQNGELFEKYPSRTPSILV